MSICLSITGAVVSWTFTVKVAGPGFPLTSVAEHFTVVVPNVKVVPEGGTQVGVIAPSTVSEAVAVKITSAPLALVASAVISAGKASVGLVVSWTITLKVLA